MTASDIFVPGRLCLFGEHSDWAGKRRLFDPGIEPGMCLITGTDQGLRGTAEAVEGCFTVRQVAADGGQGALNTYPSDPDVLRAVAASGSFDAYAAGTAALVIEETCAQGLHLDVIERTLPLKKGLSSSAAVCVLTVRAFNLVWGLGLTVEREMDLAYRGELLTGSECGRMDQACAYGKGRPVLLTFDGDMVDARMLQPGGDFYFLIVDLHGEKDTKRILRDLNAAFDRGDERLRAALGAANLMINASACRALEEGDPRALGELMVEAQRLFDERIAPACPDELTSPVLHRVLASPALRTLAWGGKGVGSQGDGSAQIICRGVEERAALAAILERGEGVTCLPLTIPARPQGQ